jgi:hypothetical protein
MGVESKSEGEGVVAVMRRINAAWLGGRVEDLAALVHPTVVMVFPGFAGRAQGRERLLAGFRDFCQNAIVREFREDDQQVDVVGDTAVVSFRYEMLYERSAKRYRATGRDLWVFARHGETWLAVWRAMLDSNENPA